MSAPTAPGLDPLHLAALWQAALSCGLHAAGCACCSGLSIRLTPDALEETILDFLEMRDDPDLKAAIAARRGRFGSSPFVNWLGELPLPGGRSAEVQAVVAGILSSVGPGPALQARTPNPGT